MFRPRSVIAFDWRKYFVCSEVDKSCPCWGPATAQYRTDFNFIWKMITKWNIENDKFSHEDKSQKFFNRKLVANPWPRRTNINICAVSMHILIIRFSLRTMLFETQNGVKKFHRFRSVRQNSSMRPTIFQNQSDREPSSTRSFTLWHHQSHLRTFWKLFEWINV